MSDEKITNELFEIYKLGGCKNAFMMKVRDAGYILSNREIGLIWEAFDRAAWEWQPRFGGM
jgi:hypothetical protein